MQQVTIIKSLKPSSLAYDSIRRELRINLTWEQVQNGLKDQVKRLPGARWDGFEWRVPLSPGIVTTLKQLATEHGIRIATDALDAAQKDEITSEPWERWWIDNDQIYLRTAYASAADVAFRLDGASWSPSHQALCLPICVESVLSVQKISYEQNIRASQDAKIRAQKWLRAELDRQDALFNASQQVDDDLPEIAGFGGVLRLFQRVGVAYCLRAKQALIADEQGLGKTVQALAVLEADKAYPAVIVCPATLRLNWRKEVTQWLPQRKVAVFGVPKRHAGCRMEEADIIVINYDILHRHVDAIRDRSPIAVVADESHHVKELKARRTKAILSLAQAGTICIRLALSGTPIMNRPIEIMSQLEFLDVLKKFGGRDQFIEQYCPRRTLRLHGKTITRFGAQNLQELSEQLRRICMIRRTKQQVLPELPAKQYVTVPVDIDNRREYRQVEQEFHDWLWQQINSNPRWLARINKLPAEDREQAAFDLLYRAMQAELLLQLGACREVCGNGKVMAAVEWIRDFLESSEKLVVFAVHREIQTRLREAFPSALTILGDDSVVARQQAVDVFQTDPDKRLIICSMKAAQAGLTLTAASNVLFMEYDWTPAAHVQAEDRCHRIGQHDAVTIYRLHASDTTDERLVHLLETKSEVIKRVMGD